MTIEAEIQTHNLRQSRIVAQLNAMPPHQLKRLGLVKQELALALSRVYGHRLKQEFRDRIVSEAVLDPRVLCTVGGGVNELPTTTDGWDALSKELAENDALAMMNVADSDAQLKEALREEALEQIPSKDRISMARTGTLDSHLDQIVKVEIEKRVGL